MQNPYDVNTNASNALMGGTAADNALGFPNPRPQAGMRAPTNLIAEAKSRLDSLRAPQVQPQQPAVFGYNPESKTFYSGGKTWSESNLSEVDNYDKAGYFDLDNTGKLPPGYSPVTADAIRAWKDKKVNSSRGFGEAIVDTGAELGSSALNILKTPIDFVDPSGNVVSNAIGGGADWLTGKQSIQTQYQKQKLGQALDSSDTATQLKGVGSYVVNNPLLSATQAIGSFGPMGVGIKGARAAVNLMKLGDRATKVAGVAAGSALSGVAAGGDAAADAYQRVFNSADLANLPEATRHEMALTAARTAQLPATALGAASGLVGAEAAVARGVRSPGGILRAGGVEAGSEFIEEGGTALSGNYGVQTALPGQNLMQGVVGQGALGGIQGGVIGAGLHALQGGPRAVPPAPAQPAAPAAPVPPPSLDAAAPVGTQGELLDAQQGPMQPAPTATPESYQEKVAQMSELTAMLPEATEVGGEYLQELQARIREIASELVSLGDNTQRQRGVMSGVNEIVSGVPTELTNDELVSGAMPMVDAGFDPQQSMFNFDQPAQQEGLAFEPTELPTAERQQAPKRKTKLTPDEMSYEGQPVAFSNADYQPGDTSAYTEPKLAAAINPKNRLPKRMPLLVKELRAATANWNEKAIEAVLRKIEKADPDIFMAADQLVNNMRQERTNALAQQGQGRAQPGQAVGTLPTPKAGTVAQMRAQSQQTLADETQPDYTPNEMDPNLVKEKGPKGPASTLALRGQTQADLDALNTREQWMAGPQERQPGPAAVPPNQLAMFDRKGQPTNPALGTPVPQSTPTEPSAPKRGPKSRKPAAADASPAVARETPANEPATTPPSRKDTGTPQKSVAATDTRTDAVNTDLTANVPEGPLDPMQQRMMSQIDKAYEADQIDAADIAPLQELVRAGRVPQARARLSELAVSNVGAGRAKFRRGGRKAGPMTLQEVLATVTEMVRGWTQGVTVKVVADPSELPQAVQDQMKRDGATDAKGAYYDGTVYVIASAQTSTQDVVETVLHELAGHHGLRGVLGDKFASTMEKIYTDNGPVRVRADAKIAAGLDKTTAVEEVLSEMQEGKSQPRNRSAWRNIVSAFKRILDKMFGAEFSDSGVEALLDRALEWTRSGTGPVPSSRFAQYRSAKDSFSPVADTLKYDVIGAAKRAVLSSSFLRDLGERYEKAIPAVRKHVDAVFKMSAKAGAKQKVAADVSAKWQNLSAKETDELSAFMGEVTLAEVHVEGDTKGLTKDEIAKRDELRAQFDAMSEPQKAAYRASRDALKNDWAETARLLGRKADEIYAPLIAKAKAAGNLAQEKSLTKERNDFAAEINARVNTIRGDYFPLSRFGQWSVVRRSDAFVALEKDADAKEQALADLTERLDQHTADQRKAMRKANRKLPEENQLEDYTPAEQAQIDKAREAAAEARALVENAKLNEENYYVAQFDRESQAQAHARQMTDAEVVYRGDPKSRGVTGVSRQMLDKLDQALESQLGSKGLSSAAREAQRSLYQIYLSSLPETSALKRQMKRTGIAGYNRDMHRNVISSLFRNSFYLSRLEHADEIGETLRSVSEEARLKGNLDLQRVAAELDRRHVASMEYVDTPIQDKVTAISYLWFLGASPAFLITNLLQPGMVTAPMLQSRHGVPATMKAMGSAYKQTFAALSKSFKSVKEFSVEASGLDKPHKDLLNYLMENRLLDVTMAHDLAVVSEGGTSSKWLRRLSNPSHYAELVNRISGGIAAYDLEYARTKDTALAQRYAAKVLADTHLDYSSENAPYWMKPGVVPAGKLLFQFKKYQLGMLSLMIKNIAALSKNRPAAERKEAMGMLAGIGITHMAMAGSMGLPVAGTAMMVFQMIASAFSDEPRDVEAEYRNWLNRTFGKDAGTALAKGLPAAFGIDMSQKVGLGSIAKPANLRDSDTKQGRDLYLEVMAAAAGPAIGGLFSRPFEFYDYAANGEMNRAAASLLPKMVGDVFKGARYLDEGVMTRQGRSLADAGGLPLTVLMAMGFPLTHVMDTYAANASKEGLKAALDDMSSDLRREWVKGSPEERATLQSSLPELNRMRISYGLRPVTMGELYRHQMQMRTGRKMPDEIKAIGEFAEE